MNFSIGILAGMGPRSTGPFIDQIITECQLQYGAVYDIDFPEMHIISLPTPFYPDKLIDDSKMSRALTYGISSLVSVGVSIIIVPCNFAHKYFPQMLEASSGIPVIHIADAAMEYIPQNVKKIAVLGTEPTLNSGLYQKRILNSGMEFISNKELRFRTTEIIKLIKERGFKNNDITTKWLMLLSYVKSLGVDAVLIACTDLSPLIERVTDKSFILVDTSRSLAASAVKAFSNHRRL